MNLPDPNKLKEELMAKFDKRFPDGEMSFCGCYSGDNANLWPGAKKELLSFITEYAKAVALAAVPEEHDYKCRDEGCTRGVAVPYKDGFNAAREEMIARIEKI